MNDRPIAFTLAQLSRFAEALMVSSPSPMVVLDRELRVVAASPSFGDLCGDTAGPLGQSLLTVDGGRWDVPELHRALDAVLPQGRSFEDVTVQGAAGDRVFVGARALYTDHGDAELLVVSFDSEPARIRTETQLHADRFADLILETLREPFLVLDYNHRIHRANAAFYRLFRVSPSGVEGRPLPEIGNGQWNIPVLRQKLGEILSTDRHFEDLEVEHRFEEIGPRTMLLNGRKIDHLRLILLAIEDVTHRKKEERRQSMLLAELAHRGKNLLAVVQSLASQTRAASADEFRSAFLGRLQALAHAQSIVLESHWRSVDLASLIHRVLAPVENGDERLHINGPAVLLLPAQVNILAMIIHELATNATKYGALSSEGKGRVDISWTTSGDEVGLEWRESGGPEITSVPTRGFGTTLLERAASYQLGGRMELHFHPAGLSFELTFSLADDHQGGNGRSGDVP